MYATLERYGGLVTTSHSPVKRLRSLPPGTRVTVRWALPAGDASGKKFTDSIGTIASSPTLDPDDDDARPDSGPGDLLVLDTRHGRVEIPWDAIHLAKPVPPPRRTPRT